MHPPEHQKCGFFNVNKQTHANILGHLSPHFRPRDSITTTEPNLSIADFLSQGKLQFLLIIENYCIMHQKLFPGPNLQHFHGPTFVPRKNDYLMTANQSLLHFLLQ